MSQEFRLYSACASLKLFFYIVHLVLPFMLFCFFLVFTWAFTLLWIIQAVNTTHLQQCNIHHTFSSFYKIDVIQFRSMGRCAQHLKNKKSHNLKNLDFPLTWLYEAPVENWTTSYLWYTPWPCELVINYPCYRCIDWSTDCLYLVKLRSNVNAFINLILCLLAFCVVVRPGELFKGNVWL